VPVSFIFDSVLRNGALSGKQPNDRVLTLRLPIDAACWEELDTLLDPVSVGYRKDVAFWHRSFP
jgi:hypothetical protein